MGKNTVKIIAIIAGIIAVLLIIMVIAAAFMDDSTTTSTTNATVATTDATTEQYTNYLDITTGAELQYPKSWQKITSQPGIVSFAEVSGANVTLTTEDLSGTDITLSEYTDLSVESLGGAGYNLTITDGYDSTTAGYPSYTLQYLISNETLDAQATAIWFIVNERAYNLSYTAPKDVYATHESTAQKIIDSINIK